MNFRNIRIPSRVKYFALMAGFALTPLVTAVILGSLLGDYTPAKSVYVVAAAITAFIIGVFAFCFITEAQSSEPHHSSWLHRCKAVLCVILLLSIVWFPTVHAGYLLDREQFFREMYERAHRHDIRLYLEDKPYAHPCMWETKTTPIIWPEEQDMFRYDQEKDRAQVFFRHQEQEKRNEPVFHQGEGFSVSIATDQSIRVIYDVQGQR